MFTATSMSSFLLMSVDDSLRILVLIQSLNLTSCNKFSALRSFLEQPQNPHEMEEAKQINSRMVMRAILMEGTCTGSSV